jgi:hypothetical protein
MQRRLTRAAGLPQRRRTDDYSVARLTRGDPAASERRRLAAHPHAPQWEQTNRTRLARQNRQEQAWTQHFRRDPDENLDETGAGARCSLAPTRGKRAR